MQTLIKRHLIGLFALVLTVTTMSFKMYEKSDSKLSLTWYSVGTPVDGKRPINSEIGEHLPGNCVANYPSTVCAVQLDNSQPIPDFLEDIASPTTAGSFP